MTQEDWNQFNKQEKVMHLKQLLSKIVKYEDKGSKSKQYKLEQEVTNILEWEKDNEERS